MIRMRFNRFRMVHNWPLDGVQTLVVAMLMTAMLVALMSGYFWSGFLGGLLLEAAFGK